MFDVMPSLERWTFAAEHDFDLCAEMGSWVPDVEQLGRTGLMRAGHTYNHCSGSATRCGRRSPTAGRR